jgi:pSer/pThr/pTyr-binding forkhead associated (FHA) protein
MGLRFIAVATATTVVGTGLDMTIEAIPLVAGRADNVDLVLEDISVSRRHFTVSASDEGWQIEDLQSSQGTRLNGLLLEPNRPVPLKEGDEIEAGVFRLLFKGKADDQPGQDSNAVVRQLALGLAGFSKSEEQTPYLEVINGPSAGERYMLMPGTKAKLGRGKRCELVVDDARISRVHGLVRSLNGQIWYADASSTNGSRINGQKVLQPTRLFDGCEIELGRITIAIVDPGQNSLDWDAALEQTGNKTSSLLMPILGIIAGASGLVLALLL